MPTRRNGPVSSNVRRMKSTLLDAVDSQFLDGLEFCARVYKIFEELRQTLNGPHEIRDRKGKSKKLVEELLPICKYLQIKYRPGRYIAVKWVDGNQQYDAELRSTGSYVTHGYYPENSFIEVTCTVHPKDYLAREHLGSGGTVFGLDGLERSKDHRVTSTPTIQFGEELIDRYAELVLTEIAKKARKPYPKLTTLVVQCWLNRLYTLKEWDKLLAIVGANKPNNEFAEIFMYDPVSEHAGSI